MKRRGRESESLKRPAKLIPKARLVVVPSKFRRGHSRQERDERQGQRESGCEVLLHHWFLLPPRKRLPIYAPNPGAKCQWHCRPLSGA
jgi:hypothetical protein